MIKLVVHNAWAFRMDKNHNVEYTIISAKVGVKIVVIMC